MLSKTGGPSVLTPSRDLLRMEKSVQAYHPNCLSTHRYVAGTFSYLSLSTRYILFVHRKSRSVHLT